MPTATTVAADDPNQPDLAAYATQFGMTPWQATPSAAENPNGDFAYIFFPRGAQNLSAFQSFYYYVFASGGGLQIVLDCAPL